MDLQQLYREYQEQQKFEHELINRRVIWLLTSQSILFAAYGLGAKNGVAIAENFQCIVARSGLISSFVLFVGIFWDIMAKFCSWRNYLKIKHNFESSSIPEQLDEMRENWGVKTSITVVALSPDLLLPILFFIAWLYVLQSHTVP